MKFKIYRTMDWTPWSDPSLDEAKYKMQKVSDSNGGWHYEIDVNSIEQLLQMSNDVGGEGIIISQPDKEELPEIEIYDTYRE